MKPPIQAGELSLEELRGFGLEENRNQEWLVHLRWMFDNQPDMVRELHRKDQLGLWVDRKYQQALETEEKLLRQGVPRDQVKEILLDRILAPPDGPASRENPPTPIPEREQIQIEELLF